MTTTNTEAAGVLTDEQIRTLRKVSAVLCGTGHHDEAGVINGLLAAASAQPSPVVSRVERAKVLGEALRIAESAQTITQARKDLRKARDAARTGEGHD